jgi:hypothetical protein
MMRRRCEVGDSEEIGTGFHPGEPGFKTI